MFHKLANIKNKNKSNNKNRNKSKVNNKNNRKNNRKMKQLCIDFKFYVTKKAKRRNET